MFIVQLEASTYAGLKEQVRALADDMLGSVTGAASVKIGKVETVKAAPVEIDEDAVAVAEPVKKPRAKKAEEVAPATVAAQSDEDAYKPVQKAIIKLANAKGRDAAAVALSPFGVQHGKDLKPEQYTAALAAVEAALEEEDDIA